MSILSPSFLAFLNDLKQNNNRDWFNTNKKRYEQDVKIPFQNFVQELILKTQEFDPEIQIEPKQAIFRIYRDTRFSKDKTPYKTHVGALISKEGRKGKEYPGYYIHIQPGALMIGGGAYFMEKESLFRLRQHIAANPTAFRSVIDHSDFVEKFGEIKGDQHKRIPKEFKEAHENEPLIANKQLYYMAELDPKNVERENAVEFVADYLKTGKTLNDFLVAAMFG